MPRVAIQPTSNQDSWKHYLDTIKNPVNILEYKEILGNDFDTLIHSSSDNCVPLWGITPGTNGANISKYKKMTVGDVVVFTRQNKVFASGIISHLFRNTELAKKLWGEKSDGQTWEYMYSLRDITDRDIPYSSLRDAIGSNSGDNFMGFRALDESKSQSVLALLDLAESIWDIELGETIKRSDLHDKYGGARYGGIEPSAKSLNVFLFTSSSGGEFGYNFDEELEDGTFLYTGDGQLGHQRIDVGGNKAIIEHRLRGKSLRLFEESKIPTYVRYLGEYEFNESEPIYRRAPDKIGEDRTVLVFRLTPIGQTLSKANEGQLSPKKLVVRRETEKNVSESHERSISEANSIALRREGKLQSRYEVYLKSQNIDVGRLDIPIIDSTAVLRPDLIDFTNKRVIEVKAGTSRIYLREAIGQVLDYVFQLEQNPYLDISGWKPAILIPGKPSNDLMKFAHSLDIELIWEEKNEFVISYRS